MPLYSPPTFLDKSSFRHIGQLMARSQGNVGVPEMTVFESSFLSGLLKKANPKKILEVGVAAGGTSAIILATLNEMRSDAHLYSVDISEQYYRDETQKTGFLVSEVFPDPPRNWSLFTGEPLPACIDRIGGEIDCVILDTCHYLPGELLDFIIALPYLGTRSLLILHDLHLYFTGGYPALATKILFDTVVGRKIICEDPDRKHFFPNIGGVFLTSDTRKYADSLFYALTLPWYAMPDEKELALYTNAIHRHYGEEYAEYFRHAAAANKEFIKVNRR